MSEPEQKPIYTEVPYSAPYYSSLLAGLIHKLNNVTTVLTGNAGLLLMGEKLPRDIREALEQMTVAIEQLSPAAAGAQPSVPSDPRLVSYLLSNTMINIVSKW